MQSANQRKEAQRLACKRWAAKNPEYRKEYQKRRLRELAIAELEAAAAAGVDVVALVRGETDDKAKHRKAPVST